MGWKLAERATLVSLAVAISLLVLSSIGSSPEEKKININTATTYELMELPSVGEKKAELIIHNRPYEDVWELSEVEGFGSETLKQIIERIEV